MAPASGPAAPLVRAPLPLLRSSAGPIAPRPAPTAGTNCRRHPASPDAALRNRAATPAVLSPLVHRGANRSAAAPARSLHQPAPASVPRPRRPLPRQRQKQRRWLRERRPAGVAGRHPPVSRNRYRPARSLPWHERDVGPSLQATAEMRTRSCRHRGQEPFAASGAFGSSHR